MIPPRNFRKSDENAASFVSASQEAEPRTVGMKHLSVAAKSSVAENRSRPYIRGGGPACTAGEEPPTSGSMKSRVAHSTEGREQDARERRGAAREGSSAERAASSAASTRTCRGGTQPDSESSHAVHAPAGSSRSPLSSDGWNNDKTEAAAGRVHMKLSPGASDCSGATSAPSSCSSSASPEKRVVEVEGVWGWEPRRRTADGRATVKVFVAGRNVFTTRSRSPSPDLCSRENPPEQERTCHGSGSEELRTVNGTLASANASLRRNGESAVKRRPRSPNSASTERDESESRREAVGIVAAPQGNEAQDTDMVDSVETKGVRSGSLQSSATMKVCIPRVDKQLVSQCVQGPTTSPITPPLPSRVDDHEAALAMTGLRDYARNAADRRRAHEEYLKRKMFGYENDGSDECRRACDSGDREMQREPHGGSSSPRGALPGKYAGGQTLEPMDEDDADVEVLKGEHHGSDHRKGGGDGDNGGGGGGGDLDVDMDADRPNSPQSLVAVKREPDKDGQQGKSALSSCPMDTEEARNSNVDGEQDKTPQSTRVDSGDDTDSGAGPGDKTATTERPKEHEDRGARDVERSGEGEAAAEALRKEDGDKKMTKSMQETVSMSAAKVAADKRESKSESMVEIQILPSGEPIYSLKPGTPRRGKWCRLEQEYAKRVISDFDEGLLDVEAGTGLRQLLASKLQCEVMRVSKKFCGLESVGKRSFRPLRGQEARVRWAQASLFAMEQSWLASFFPNNPASRGVHDSASSPPLTDSPEGVAYLDHGSMSGEPDRAGGMEGADTQRAQWGPPLDRRGAPLDSEREHYGQRERVASIAAGYAMAGSRGAYYPNAAWVPSETLQDKGAWVRLGERHPDYHAGPWCGEGGDQRWRAPPNAPEPAGGIIGNRDEGSWRSVREPTGAVGVDEGRSSRRHRHPYGWVPSGVAHHGPDNPEAVAGDPRGWHPRHPHHADVERHQRSSGDWQGARNEPLQLEFARDYREHASDAIPDRSRQPQLQSQPPRHTDHGDVRKDKSSDTLYPIYSKRGRYDSPPEEASRMGEEPGAESRSLPPDPFHGGRERAPPRRQYSPAMVSREDGEGCRDYGGGGGDWPHHRDSDAYATSYVASDNPRRPGVVYYPAHGPTAAVEGSRTDYPREIYPAEHPYTGHPDDRERYDKNGKRGGGGAGWRPVGAYPPDQRHPSVAALPPHLRVHNGTSAVFFSAPNAGVHCAAERGNHREPPTKMYPVIPSTARTEGASRHAAEREAAQEQTELQARWASSPNERPTKAPRLPGFFPREGGGGSGAGRGRGDDREGGYHCDRVVRPTGSWAGEPVHQVIDGPPGTSTGKRWRSEMGSYQFSVPGTPHERKRVYHPEEDERRGSFSGPVGRGGVMSPDERSVSRVERQSAEVRGDGGPGRTNCQR